MDVLILVIGINCPLIRYMDKGGEFNLNNLA